MNTCPYAGFCSDGVDSVYCNFKYVIGDSVISYGDKKTEVVDGKCFYKEHFDKWAENPIICIKLMLGGYTTADDYKWQSPNATIARRFLRWQHKRNKELVSDRAG